MATDVLFPPNFERQGLFVGDCWSVWSQDGKHFLEYVSGQVNGNVFVIEISEIDYEEVRLKNYSHTELCIKLGIS